MTQRRVTATNQLSTVINALQLGKKTGVLAVERGEGEALEEGTLTFVHGQLVQAAIGWSAGRDAATKILSWQACRFSFTSSLAEEIAQKADSMPPPHLDIRAAREPTPEPFSLGQQPYRAAPDGLGHQPSIVAYKQSTEEILHFLDLQGFSRVHRRLFLLINGRRSIRELAELIKRPPTEVAVLLADLEQVGLIQL